MIFIEKYFTIQPREKIRSSLGNIVKNQAESIKSGVPPSQKKIKPLKIWLFLILNKLLFPWVTRDNYDLTILVVTKS